MTSFMTNPQQFSQAPKPVTPTPVPQVPPFSRLAAPIGKPADANPSMVNPGMAPVSAVAPPPPPAPVSSAPAGSNTSSFGPGNDLLSTQINPNTGGPDRTALAKQSVQDWETATAPQFAADQRTIGQNAAKFGRIGAGMTTNDLTGLEATHNRDRMLFQNQLASNLADATINDQRSNNNELRTERDYQTNRSDKATQDAINQRNQEEDLLNSAFGRATTRAQFGYGGSPVDTLTKFSGALGSQAGQSIGAGTDLLRSDPGSWSSQIPQVTQNGRPIQITDLIR